MELVIISNITYSSKIDECVERKKPLKRDQALNDAISGQIGEEPRPEPSSDVNEQRLKTARKMSRDL